MTFSPLALLVIDYSAIVWLLIALAVVIVGALFILLAVLLALSKMRFKRVAASTPGTVLKSVHDVQQVGGRTLLSSMWAHSNYSATIKASYKTPAGEAFETTDTVPIPTGGQDYFDGDPITVYYDPAYPKKAKLYLPSSSAIMRRAMIPAVLGLAMAIFGLFLMPSSLQTYEVTSRPAPTPNPSPARTPDASDAILAPPGPKTDAASYERAKRGESLFQNLLSQKDAEIPKVWGMGKRAELNVRIDETAWKKLSKEQQVDLSYYAENMLTKVYNHPEPYTSVGPSDSYYKYALGEARYLCDSCWSIVLGTKGKDGIAGYIGIGVAGETAWENKYANFPNDKPKHIGEKASNFRT